MPGGQADKKVSDCSFCTAYQRDIQLKLTFESRLKSEKINMREVFFNSTVKLLEML